MSIVEEKLFNQFSMDADLKNQSNHTESDVLGLSPPVNHFVEGVVSSCLYV